MERVFEYCRQGEASKTDRLALEIGACTGKATLHFLECGYAVTAVEASPAMCDFLRTRFCGPNTFRVINSVFEDEFDYEGGAAVIYAASVFHWLDSAKACPKPCSLLRDGGCLVILRYNWSWDESYDLPAAKAAREEHYCSYYNKPAGVEKFSRELLPLPHNMQRDFGFTGLEDYGFSDVKTEFCELNTRYSADEYIALLDTMSDYRALPDAKRLPLYDRLHKAILDNGDSCRVDYCFRAYMGRKKRGQSV